MEILKCEIRLAEDESRLSPGRLTGTLLTYETRASDRPELFARGALHWPENGIIINDQHQRNQASFGLSHSLKTTPSRSTSLYRTRNGAGMRPPPYGMAHSRALASSFTARMRADAKACVRFGGRGWSELDWSTTLAIPTPRPRSGAGSCPHGCSMRTRSDGCNR